MTKRETPATPADWPARPDTWRALAPVQVRVVQHLTTRCAYYVGTYSFYATWANRPVCMECCTAHHRTAARAESCAIATAARHGAAVHIIPAVIHVRQDGAR